MTTADPWVDIYQRVRADMAQAMAERLEREILLGSMDLDPQPSVQLWLWTVPRSAGASRVSASSGPCPCAGACPCHDEDDW